MPYNLDKKYNKKKEQGIIDLIGNLLLPRYRLSYIIYNTRTLRFELRIWSLEFPILPIKLCSFLLVILFSCTPLIGPRFYLTSPENKTRALRLELRIWSLKLHILPIKLCSLVIYSNFTVLHNKPTVFIAILLTYSKKEAYRFAESNYYLLILTFLNITKRRLKIYSLIFKL